MKKRCFVGLLVGAVFPAFPADASPASPWFALAPKGGISHHIQPDGKPETLRFLPLRKVGVHLPAPLSQRTRIAARSPQPAPVAAAVAAPPSDPLQAKLIHDIFAAP